jgi:outer membrane protein OmpA-like peptidoglycan-associated protein
MNMKVESKLRELGWRDDNSYRYPVIAATSGINAGRTRFESINFQPLSVSAGLSFIISVGNNKDQVDEILNEERRSDSLRLVNSNVTHRMDSLRQRSIGLADKAITKIIHSYKISDRIAELEKQQLEKQKTALKTELSDTKKKVFQALFSAVTGTNDDGTETAENPTLRIEQFQAKTTKSLLPKIFFDQGSALLSTRYKRIQAAERESYKLPQDPFQSAYALYPNILNIVGKRLQTSSAKLTLTGFQTNDETDAKLAEKRVESVATYLQDIWKIPASRITRTVSKGTGTSADERRVEITSESADITAPLAIDYTTRLANPPILNIGLDISTGAGLKQWELEIQQVVNNQGVVLKDTTGGANFPPRFVWRLNEEPATMPQSSEPLSMRIGAYDINNAAAPDAPLKTIKVEQITLEQKRANKTKDKTVQQFEVLFGTNLTELDASSRRALDAAKAAITPQSKVLVTVFGGNASVSAKGVAQALSIDARSAVLRDAGNVPHSSSLPEAAAYNRIIRIRVETPTGM